MTFEEKAEVVISQLRTDRDRLQNIIKQIRAEIEELIEELDIDDDYQKGVSLGLENSLEIIDKHKTEIEDK